MSDGTSVDNLIFQKPGLIPQVSENLTSSRFCTETIHVENISRLIHVTLFQGPTNDETLEAKNDNKRELHGNDHEVRAYRFDNSRLNSKSFMDDCILERQKLTFCGAGAHHQN